MKNPGRILNKKNECDKESNSCETNIKMENWNKFEKLNKWEWN